MFENVLLPTDFSEDSSRVLRYVRDLPGARTVTLFHVADGKSGRDENGEEDRPAAEPFTLLEEARQAIRSDPANGGVVVQIRHSSVTNDDVARTILDAAQEMETTLIMMGARGKNRIRSVLLGSVSANVIRRSTIPVLLMRFPPEGENAQEHAPLFSRVLVPVDFSVPSDLVLRTIPAIVRAGQAVLVHVVDRGESDSAIRAAAKEAHQRLEAMREDLARQGIPARTRVSIGYPPDEIIEAAAEERSSLILMSPQGAGWVRELRTLVVGSTTSSVIRRANCPVLIDVGARQG
jgi:nucleotide-binding universal stress UspA family protein